MKKENIIFGIIIVSVAIISIATTYFIINKQEKDKNISNKIEEKEENFTLSEKQLEEYLEYVPSITLDEDYDFIYKKNTKIDSIKEETLLDYTISYVESLGLSISDSENYERLYTKKSDVEKYLKKLYNKNLSDFKFDYKKGFSCYEYDNDREQFYNIGGGGGPEIRINFIENYEANNKELIIYEYHASYFEDILSDYRKDTKINIIDFDNAINYIKKHKNEFTLYRHIFKKSSDGYYWYSTEA